MWSVLFLFGEAALTIANMRYLTFYCTKLNGIYILVLAHITNYSCNNIGAELNRNLTIHTFMQYTTKRVIKPIYLHTSSNRS